MTCLTAVRRAAVRGAAAVLAAGLLAAGTGCGGRGPGGGAVPSAPDAVAALVDLKPIEVHRVRVTAPGSEVRLVRAGAGRWLAEGATPFASTTAMRAAEADLFPLRSYRRFVPDRPDPAFGLTEPGLVVTIADQHGRTTTIDVGAATFTGGGIYARRTDNPEIHLLARGTLAALLGLFPDGAARVAAAGRATPVVPPSPPPSKGEPAVVNPWLRQALSATGAGPSTAEGERR